MERRRFGYNASKFYCCRSEQTASCNWRQKSNEIERKQKSLGNLAFSL